MSQQPSVLAFAGSIRQDSFNKKLLNIAARGAEEAGAKVTLIDLRDYPLPLFDEETEKLGPPENLVKLHQLFLQHNGLLISSPEYNSSITPLTKNTIDWVSRPSPGVAGLAGIRGKVASLISASPGALGGLRGLVHLRSILGNIGVIVLPEQMAIPKAHEAFSADGKLKDEKLSMSVAGIGRTLAETLKKLCGT